MADKQIIRISTPLLGDGTGGTTTSHIIGGKAQDFIAISSAILYVPAGLVVTTEITHDTIGDNLPAPVWIRTETVTGAEEAVISEPCTAIRITRTSGSGVIRGAALQGSTIGSFGSVYDPITGALLVQEINRAIAENNPDGVIEVSHKLLGNGTDAYSVDTSSALEASSVASATAARFYGIKGYIDKSAANAEYFILVMRAGSLPANGAVTLAVAPIPVSHTTTATASSKFEYALNLNGVYCPEGIVWAVSSTAPALTISSAVAVAQLSFKN